MSENYKKYLDKAKKNKQSSDDSKSKQEKEFKELYKQYHLKYSDGGQVQESQQKTYQAKDYFGKEDGDSSGPLSRMSSGGPVYPKGQFKDEDYSKRGLDTIIHHVHHYDEGTPDVPQNSIDKITSFVKGLTAATGTPTPKAPSADDDRAARYAKIREDAAQNFGHSSAGFADGTPSVPDKSSADKIQDFLSGYLSKVGGPTPTPTPDPNSREEKNRKIRQQQQDVMSGKTSEVDQKTYFEGTPDVSANTSSSLAPLLKNTYSDKKRKYSDGGTVGPQTPEEAGVEAVAKRAALLKNAGFGPDQSADEVEAEAKEKKRLEQEPKQNYDQGTSNVQTPPIDPKKAQQVSDSFKNAFSDGGTVPLSKDEVYKRYMKLFSGTPKVPTESTSLASVHAPAEYKIPLNIPRPGHIKIPKRLGSVKGIKTFDEGTPNVTPNQQKTQDAQDSLRKAFHFDAGTDDVPNAPTPAPKTPPADDKSMDLGDIPITADLGPYPGEEEEAQKTADASTAGQLDKISDEMDAEKAAKDKEEEAPEEKPSKKELEKDVRTLKGDTLSKDEALKEDDPDKKLEDQYAKEKDDANKAADDSEKDRAPASEDEDKSEEKPEQKFDNVTPQAPYDPMAKLKQAQLAQNLMTVNSQIGSAGDIMAASMGHYKPQYQEFYADQEKQAAVPVQQLEQRMAMEKYDPNSPTSQSFRNYLAKFGGQDVTKLGNISAAQAEQIAPMAFKQFEAQQAQGARAQELKARNEERLQQTQMIADQRREAAKDRNLMMKLMMDNKNQATKDKQAQMEADKQNKIFASTGQLLEQMRGSPAVSQAEKDIYASSKADSLANLYPDPNKLSPTQVRLLATEVSKVASGGAPTMEELKGVTPDTFRGQLAGVVQKFTNSPSPANAADFIQQYKDYTKALTKDAQKVIQDRYGRIIEPRKSLMSDDQYDALKQQYTNRFNPQSTPAGQPDASAAQPTSGKVVVRKGYNAKTNQTQLVYSDGTKQIVDGKQ